MLQWDHLIFPLILKQNYMLTEISKRMWWFVEPKKNPTNQHQPKNQHYFFLPAPPFLSNQIRDYEQEAARSYTGSDQTNTANLFTKFTPATRGKKSATCLSLGLIALASRLALHLAGKFRKTS